MSSQEIDQRVLEGKVVPDSGFTVPSEFLDQEWLEEFERQVQGFLLHGNAYFYVPGDDLAFKADTSQPRGSEGWAHYQAAVNISICPDHLNELTCDTRRDYWQERLIGPARCWFWVQRCRLGNLLISAGDKLLGDGDDAE